ncbi:sensor histidine kinase [Nonomuraea sp. NPDC050786]|uniref:sensor histidine kinase n=1 Tax=Nonomuraea sp. NPDC050786 TaxID=3154840 RepID=UPI0033FE8633
MRRAQDRAARLVGVAYGWGCRVASAPYAPVVAGVVLALLAVAESVAHAGSVSAFSETVSAPVNGPVSGAVSGSMNGAVSGSMDGSMDGSAVRSEGAPLILVVFSLLALATTLPMPLLWAQPAVAAVLTSGACLLSISAFHTLTVAGAVAQLVTGYRFGRHGSPVAAVLVTMPYPVLAAALGPGDQVRRLTLLLAFLAPAAALAGIAVRTRRTARADTAARQVIADSLLEHTARGERARIARELHDVVAHHISMVAVQAETARLAVPGMPAAGAERLLAIGDTARAALTEMRRLLGVLREDAEAEAAWRPQPGLRLHELNELVDEAREASGTSTRLILRGSPVELDPGVELAAYRIIQEALTNARRHAPGAAVDVELDYTGDDLRLLIRDNGPGTPSAAAAGHEAPGLRTAEAARHDVAGRRTAEAAGRDAPGKGTAEAAGHGLAGMRERAAAVGGELRTGPAHGGGFLVEARLPGRDGTGG